MIGDLMFDPHAYLVHDGMVEWAGMFGGVELAHAIVPVDERCWWCDQARMHDFGTEAECKPGLCTSCCTKLKNEFPVAS